MLQMAVILLLAPLRLLVAVAAVTLHKREGLEAVDMQKRLV
jgi:hypothetical protein